MNYRIAVPFMIASMSQFWAPYASAQPQRFQLHANGYRPLALAAEQIEERYGVQISCEDAEYVHETDLVDATNAKWRGTSDRADTRG